MDQKKGQTVDRTYFSIHEYKYVLVYQPKGTTQVQRARKGSWFAWQARAESGQTRCFVVVLYTYGRLTTSRAFSVILHFVLFTLRKFWSFLHAFAAVVYIKFEKGIE